MNKSIQNNVLEKDNNTEKRSKRSSNVKTFLYTRKKKFHKNDEKRVYIKKNLD